MRKRVHSGAGSSEQRVRSSTVLSLVHAVGSAGAAGAHSLLVNVSTTVPAAGNNADTSSRPRDTHRFLVDHAPYPSSNRAATSWLLSGGWSARSMSKSMLVVTANTAVLVLGSASADPPPPPPPGRPDTRR